MDLVAISQKALAMLLKHGGPMVLIAPGTAGTLDPVTDVETPATKPPVSYAVQGFLPPPGSGFAFEAGTLIERTGERAKVIAVDSATATARGLPVLTLEPKPGWQLQTSTQLFRVTRVRKVQPDGVTTVIYDLDLAS